MMIILTKSSTWAKRPFLRDWWSIFIVWWPAPLNFFFVSNANIYVWPNPNFYKSLFFFKMPVSLHLCVFLCVCKNKKILNHKKQKILCITWVEATLDFRLSSSSISISSIAGKDESTTCSNVSIFSNRGDFAKTDCSQKRIFRLKAKKIKKYAKPNHGIFLFSPWTGIYHGLVWHISLFS